MLKRKQLIIFCLSIWSFVFAELKIGYIDSNEIMSSFEEVKQVKVDLEKVQRRMENEMNNLMTQLDSLRQDYERQRLLMSENRRQEKENELRNLEENIQKFQMAKFGPEGEIYHEQNILLKPVLAKIDAAIKNHVQFWWWFREEENPGEFNEEYYRKLREYIREHDNRK